MEVFAEPTGWIISSSDSESIRAEPISWIIRGLDDGLAYGAPIVFAANLSITLEHIAELRNPLATRPVDDEMRAAINSKCLELGATKVHDWETLQSDFVANATLDQLGDCDVRALLSTVEFSQEMSLRIKTKCVELGATGIIRMVRYKNGKQVQVRLRLRSHKNYDKDRGV